MNHKHTPGPWFFPPYPNNHGGNDIFAQGGNLVIADTWAIGEFQDNETIANAQLIAAAPDMLAALEEVTRNVFWDSDKDQAVWQMDGKTTKMVRDAIHKATGKEV